MGDWGYKAYENDEAAAWFGRFWQDGGFEHIIRTVADFNPADEQYDAIRAAAHVLECFGSAYTCPPDFLEQRIPLLRQLIAILHHMIYPPNEDWAFMEIWGHAPEVMAEVQRQIAALRAHLPQTDY